VTRRAGRTQNCGAKDARIRLRQAELYLEVAEVVLLEETAEQATIATGNAVLAGIAAADAICCASAGARYRGSDHREAADHLEGASGDKKLAALLRDVVDAKDGGHYGLTNVHAARARSAVRKAGRLVEEARQRVR
jgi:hypothetical protein